MAAAHPSCNLWWATLFLIFPDPKIYAPNNYSSCFCYYLLLLFLIFYTTLLYTPSED